MARHHLLGLRPPVQPPQRYFRSQGEGSMRSRRWTPALRAAAVLAGAIAAALVTAAAGAAPVAAAPVPPMQPDIPLAFAVPSDEWDYTRREVMIPMRDGVKLHTVILVPRGAQRAPIILTRTPYGASKRAERIASSHMTATLSAGDDVLATAGYIRVFQDVRGK